jgi:hypothetical protein
MDKAQVEQPRWQLICFSIIGFIVVCAESFLAFGLLLYTGNFGFFFIPLVQAFFLFHVRKSPPLFFIFAFLPPLLLLKFLYYA